MAGSRQPDRRPAPVRGGQPQHPITSGTLNAAGLHRLAQLSADQLTALAAEAGLERGLLHLPHGHWTVERVIDAYAAECHKAGATLSTVALAALGGAALSLRAYAQRHFPSFRAFQQAVQARHPDIKLPGRPTTRDGVVLDSWQEVACHQGVRHALPDARIDVHVILPGEKQRSGDFLVDGRVWVEVLGVAVADMAAPRTAREGKYAAQWRAKAAVYAALGIDPVLIEPQDIHDPRRLAQKVEEIARRLGATALPAPSPSGRVTRAKGVWDEAMLCRAVAAVAGDTGVFPTHAALAQAGHGHAVNLLRGAGTKPRIAAALGLRLVHVRGGWTEDRVIDGVVAWVAAHNAYPTNAELKASGLSRLASARARLFAGRQSALRQRIEQASGGRLLPQRHAATGSYDTWEQIVDAFRPLCATLGRMPTALEATRAKLGTPWSRASRLHGIAALAQALGLPYHGPRHLTREDGLAEFRAVADSVGDAPLTCTVIRARMGYRGIAVLQRQFGGIAALKVALAAASDSPDDDGSAARPRTRRAGRVS